MSIEQNQEPPEGIENHLVHKEQVVPGLSESMQWALVGVDAEEVSAVEQIDNQVRMIGCDVPPELKTKGLALAEESRYKLGVAASEAKVRLSFLEKTGGLEAFPESDEVETSLRIGDERAGASTLDSVWGEKASAAAKRHEPVELDEEIPGDTVRTKTPEKTAEEFDALKQYEKLRLVLEQEVKGLQPIKTFLDTYSWKALQLTLSKASQSSPRSRFLAGAILDEFSATLKTRADSGKNTDKKAAEEAWKAFVKSGVFEQLKEIFNAAESFGTSDPNIASERFAAMSAKKAMAGRTSGRDTLLMALLSEARNDISKTKEASSTKTKKPESPPQRVAEVLKQAPPKVEKRGGAIALESEGQQEWLDNDREEGFKKVSEYFHALDTTGDQENIREWFVAVFNTACLNKDNALTVADVQSLVMTDVTSPSASKIAGREIRRPVLLFGDPKEMRKFALSLGVAHANESTGGMQVPGSAFAKESIFNKTGLLISIANKEFIGHEIRHSIDPYVSKRTGVDKAIDEAFAYYHEEIEGKLDNDNEVPGRAWEGYLSALTDETYEQQYFVDMEKTSIPGAWKQDVRKLIDAMALPPKLVHQFCVVQ